MVLSWDDGLNALVVEGIEAIVFRIVGDQCSLWESTASITKSARETPSVHHVRVPAKRRLS